LPSPVTGTQHACCEVHRCSESCSHQACERIGFTRSRPDLRRFRVAFVEMLSVRSPDHLRARVHPLVSLRLLCSSSPHLPAPCRSRAHAFPGFVLHRDVNESSPPTGEVPSSRLRSARSVSHALDGLLLDTPVRVYFVPLPRPRFSPQGFPPTLSRLTFVKTYPLVVPTARLHRVAPLHQLPVFASRVLIRPPIRCRRGMV